MVGAWKEKERREDLRVARLMALIANTNRDSKKKPKPYSEKDFIPMTKDERMQSDLEDMKRFLNSHKTLFKRVN